MPATESSPNLSSAPDHFLVGQDAQGHWVVVESHRRMGALFRSRQDALHFLDLETSRRPDAVEIAKTPLRLDF